MKTVRKSGNGIENGGSIFPSVFLGSRFGPGISRIVPVLAQSGKRITGPAEPGAAAHPKVAQAAKGDSSPMALPDGPTGRPTPPPRAQTPVPAFPNRPTPNPKFPIPNPCDRASPAPPGSQPASRTLAPVPQSYCRAAARWPAEPARWRHSPQAGAPGTA